MNKIHNNEPIAEEAIVDEYALNDESIKFAECFCLNNYEINIVKVYYKKLQKKLKTKRVNGYDIIKEFNLAKIPMYNSLFRIYESNSLSWNDFFQFVIFFSLNPTVVIYYFILHALCSCNGSVEWSHLVNMFKLIKRQQAICDEVLQLFKQQDLNSDGKISLNQFFNFLSLSFALLDPINYFRLATISNVLTFERIKIILERRSDIQNINKYLESHNNQLPPEICSDKLSRKMIGAPHPLHYDYDNRVDGTTFCNLVEIYIKKYDSGYVFKQETFAIKYLSAYGLNEFVKEIDELYIKIRNNDPEVTRRISLLPTTKSDLGKASEPQVGVRKKSILKQRRMNTLSNSTGKFSASTQIYSLVSQTPHHQLPKGSSLSSKNFVTAQSSIVPII